MKCAIGIGLVGAVMAIAMPQPASAQLSVGLMAHYLFEGNANDASGNGYHGTLVNGVASAVDRFGRSNHAFGFDGFDDRIQLHGASIHGLTNLTMSFWLQTTDAGTVKHFVSAARSGQANEFLLRHDNGQTYAIDKGRGRSFPGSSYNDGRWHQLVFTRTSSRMDLYLDGARASNWIVGSSSLSVAANGLWLGGDQDWVAGGWDSNQQYRGNLDDLRIYNRALSETEVEDLHRMELIPEPSPMLILGVVLGWVALRQRRRGYDRS